METRKTHSLLFLMTSLTGICLTEVSQIFLTRELLPVRFVWGDKDAFGSPDSGLKKASAIRDYKFEVVENAGHMPWLDQLEKCSSQIIKSLEN